MVKHLLFTCSGSPAYPDRETGVTSQKHPCSTSARECGLKKTVRSTPVSLLSQASFFSWHNALKNASSVWTSSGTSLHNTLRFIETWFQARVSASFSGQTSCASLVWWSRQYSGEVLQFPHTSAFLEEGNSCWVLHQIPIPKKLSAS